MKAIHLMIAALGLAFVLPAAVEAATTDPEVIIYRFPGVRDDAGGVNSGIATVFHCTNFSGVTENLRFVTRREDGTIMGNVVTPIQHLRTISAVTHTARAYHELLTLGLFPGDGTGPINSGTTAIAATSINLICTAETIDASAAVPIGIARRGIRFSPVPGSQE
jgi:hypothetical protein